MPVINIDGRLMAEDGALPHDNRAFRYGYGLFETMLYRDGQIELAPYHWERLFAGMEQLHFEKPKHFTPQMMEHEVQRTVRRNGLEALCRVRLQVWPGNGGLYDAGTFAPHFLVECFPLQNEVTQLNENGLTVGIAQHLFKSMDSLANLKSCNSLIYAMAARQAKAHKWNDALVCNTEDGVIESTIANIFWIKNDVVHTPPLVEGCINGVMRRHLLDKLRTENITVTEKKLPYGELILAEEVFLTNAIRKIKWVKQLGDISYRIDKCQAIASLL